MADARRSREGWEESAMEWCRDDDVDNVVDDGGRKPPADQRDSHSRRKSHLHLELATSERSESHASYHVKADSVGRIDGRSSEHRRNRAGQGEPTHRVARARSRCSQPAVTVNQHGDCRAAGRGASFNDVCVTEAPTPVAVPTA